MAPKASHRKTKLAVLRACVCAVVFFGLGIALFFHQGWGNLSSLGIGAIAYICPLSALEVMVSEKTLIPRAIVALVGFAVVTALVGKAFCAWICPTPHIANLFSSKADKKTYDKKGDNAQGETDCPKVECALGCESSAVKGCGIQATSDAAEPLEPLGGKRDGFRLDLRHVTLAGALLSAAVFGFPVFCLICPIGLSFAFFVALWQLFGLHDPTWSLLVIPAVLAIELVFLRKWCHKFCPLGALASLLSQKAPFFKPKASAEKCLRSKGIDCTECVNICPEEIDPHSEHIGECTKCGACVEACPARAISMRFFGAVGSKGREGKGPGENASEERSAK